MHFDILIILAVICIKMWAVKVLCCIVVVVLNRILSATITVRIPLGKSVLWQYKYRLFFCSLTSIIKA